MEKKIEVGVLEFEEETKDEDINVKEVDVVSNVLKDHPVEIKAKCQSIVPVFAQPFDEVLALVQDEIQSSLANVPASKALVCPTIVDTVHVHPIDDDLVFIQKE